MSGSPSPKPASAPSARPIRDGGARAQSAGPGGADHRPWSGQPLTVLAVTVTVVLWASAFVGIRATSEHFSAGSIALARLLVGGLALGSVVVARRDRLPGRQHLPRLLVCGAVWFGMYNLALNQAERLVDAGTAAVVVNIGPILVAALAGLALGEGFPRQLFLGGAVAFAGVTIIGTSSAGGTASSLGGVALCLLAALGYAVGAVAQKPLLRSTSPLMVTWLSCLIGAITCAVFAPALLRELGTARLGDLGWLLYLGLFPTAIGFTTWAYALARTTAGKLAATTYLVPPVAVILSWLLLDELPAAMAFIGGLLCLVGVAVTRRAAPAARAGPPARRAVAS